jgi:flagellar biosynthetic protein FliQ
MTDATVLEIGLRAAILAAKVSAPVLIVSLLVGIMIGLVQSVTQLQEITLSFVPKLFAVGVSLLLFGSWMLREMTGFTAELYGGLPALLRGG